MVPFAVNAMAARAACRALTAWIAARSEPAPASFTFVTAMVTAGNPPSFEATASAAGFPTVSEGIAFNGPLEAQPDHSDALMNVKAAAANTWRRSSKLFKKTLLKRAGPFRPALDRLTVP